MFCLLSSSHIDTSSFRTPVLPASLLAIRRSSLSSNAFGLLGIITVALPVPLPSK